MILVLNPTKRDQFWEHRNERMNREIKEMKDQVEGYKGRLDELQTIQARAPPQEQEGVQREIDETRRAIRLSKAGSDLRRTQLQIGDDREPAEITTAFWSINRDIDNLCRDISEDLAYLCTQEAEPPIKTSLDVRNMQGVQRALYGKVAVHPSLIQSSFGTGRPIAEFMDFSLQFLINRDLNHYIFRPFHPLMTSDENKCISRLYEGLRRQGG